MACVIRGRRRERLDRVRVRVKYEKAERCHWIDESERRGYRNYHEKTPVFRRKGEDEEVD